MQSKKDSSKSHIQVGDITASDNSNVNVATGDIHQVINRTSGAIGDNPEMLFKLVYQAIERRPNTPTTTRDDLRAEFEDVENGFNQAKQFDESFVGRRLRNIQRMAPDILDVIIATFCNPAAGVLVAIRKIAEKIKKEAK